MKKLKKILITCTFIMSIFCFCCIPVKADTDGTELNVLAPSKLEIQLGQDWSGVQFQLKTDVGLYPEEITVGEDGVLRLEIGGSSTYILTCLNSEVAAPSPDQTDCTPVSEDSDDAETTPSEYPSGNAYATYELFVLVEPLVNLRYLFPFSSFAISSLSPG